MAVLIAIQKDDHRVQKSVVEINLQCSYDAFMAILRFAWDPGKASTNASKHGVTFTEAKTVFLDEHAVEYSDPDHSEEEDRFILIGVSRGLRVLVICFCYRSETSTIRIISARKATAKEDRVYGGRIR
jgi:hypothetical protein